MEKELSTVYVEGRRGLLNVLSDRGLDVQYKCQTYEADEPCQMTNARLLARFLSRFRWYNPRAGKVSDYNEGTGSTPPPSIDKAWAFYEHVTLARYYVDDPTSDDMDRAVPGDVTRKTELYPFWGTPVKELMDWGISMRIYFNTLLFLASFLTVAGILNLPLSWYFRSLTYTELGKNEIDIAIRGSAICNEVEWVACEDCNDVYQPYFPSNRLDGENVLINSCNFSDFLVQGFLSFAASIALVVAFGVTFFWAQSKAEIVFDEQIQTASDYSIKISNPPPDAYDPVEWKQFLTPFADKKVTFCTVAVDNADLIKALIQRRRLLNELRWSLPLDTDLNDRESILSALGEIPQNSGWRRAICACFPDVHSLYAKVQDIEEEIIGDLLQREYKVTAVFATFETERGQRNALTALSTGKYHVWQNKLDTKFHGNEITVNESAQSSSLELDDLATACVSSDDMLSRSFRLPNSKRRGVDSFLLFRGKHVLSVKEPGETNDVRWQDLQVSTKAKVQERLLSIIGFLIFIALSGFLIKTLEKNYPGRIYTPLFIAISNTLVPSICMILNKFESHATEGGRQASLYVKIALFRWFNSAIVTCIVTGFVLTISYEEDKERESLLYEIYPIIFAEMITNPLIVLFDFEGIYNKHILAPRARDQDEMNAFFTGSEFELAERYTDCTKILFMTFFYSAILPAAFFMGAATLMIHFLVGKFCLLRTWKAVPDIGTQLSRFSRNYFFSSALVAHIVMSAYWWSGYPYDNVCENEESGEYVFCNQDFLRSHVFPPLPRFQTDQWMSSSQETLTSLYGWSSLFIVGFGSLVLLREIITMVASIFRSTYEPDGKDQGIDFSSVTNLHEVSCYIPQYREQGFSHPLLACDIKDIDEDLVGWKDQVRGFDPHNLINDAYSLGWDPAKNQVFSVVKHWPPKSVTLKKSPPPAKPTSQKDVAPEPPASEEESFQEPTPPEPTPPEPTPSNQGARFQRPTKMRPRRFRWPWKRR